MNRTKLKEVLADKSFPKKSIETFIEIVDIPKYAEEVEVVRPALPQLIKKVIELAPHYPKVAVDPLWDDLAAALQDIEIDETEQSRMRKKDPLRGWYQVNSIYVALWQSIKSNSVDPTYLTLLAHIILAKLTLIPRVKKYPEHKNILISAPNALRRVCKEPFLSLLSEINPQCSGCRQ